MTVTMGIRAARYTGMDRSTDLDSVQRELEGIINGVSTRLTPCSIDMRVC